MSDWHNVRKALDSLAVLFNFLFLIIFDISLLINLYANFSKMCPRGSDAVYCFLLYPKGAIIQLKLVPGFHLGGVRAGESLTCNRELLLLTALSTAAFAPSVAVNHRSLKMSQQDESHLRLQTG